VEVDVGILPSAGGRKAKPQLLCQREYAADEIENRPGQSQRIKVRNLVILKNYERPFHAYLRI
jgi:hypothetical protein